MPEAFKVRTSERLQKSTNVMERAGIADMRRRTEQ